MLAARTQALAPLLAGLSPEERAMLERLLGRVVVVGAAIVAAAAFLAPRSDVVHEHGGPAPNARAADRV